MPKGVPFTSQTRSVASWRVSLSRRYGSKRLKGFRLVRKRVKFEAGNLKARLAYALCDDSIQQLRPTLTRVVLRDFERQRKRKRGEHVWYDTAEDDLLFSSSTRRIAHRRKRNHEKAIERAARRDVLGEPCARREEPFTSTKLEGRVPDTLLPLLSMFVPPSEEPPRPPIPVIEVTPATVVRPKGGPLEEALRILYPNDTDSEDDGVHLAVPRRRSRSRSRRRDSRRESKRGVQHKQRQEQARVLSPALAPADVRSPPLQVGSPGQPSCSKGPSQPVSSPGHLSPQQMLSPTQVRSPQQSRQARSPPQVRSPPPQPQSPVPRSNQTQQNKHAAPPSSRPQQRTTSLPRTASMRARARHAEVAAAERAALKRAAAVAAEGHTRRRVQHGRGATHAMERTSRSSSSASSSSSSSASSQKTKIGVEGARVQKVEEEIGYALVRTTRLVLQ